MTSWPTSLGHAAQTDISNKKPKKHYDPNIPWNCIYPSQDEELPWNGMDTMRVVDRFFLSIFLFVLFRYRSLFPSTSDTGCWVFCALELSLPLSLY